MSGSLGSLACVITLPSFIALLTLFFWTLASNIFGNDNNNDEQQRGWWEDMNREEKRNGLKLIINLLGLCIACGTLMVPISMARSGVQEKFNVGVLAASLFMFGNMLFVSFWYQIDLDGIGEEEMQDNNQYNGYNPWWYKQMDERELLEYHQKVVSYVCLALTISFYAISTCTYSWARAQPGSLVRSTSRNDPYEQRNRAHLSAQFEMLSEIWTFISLCTLVIFIGLSIASLVLLGSEDADRMREKARLINMIIINVWMVVVSLFMMFWGNEVFSVKRRGNLGMGMLYGGCKYFSSLLLLVCFLFASFSFDQREREESTWVGCKCIFCLFRFYTREL